jgi:two-component system chemotaxis response regulator CheY
MSKTPARVLIVDDSPIVRAMHEYIFQAAGFDTLQAESGFLALEALQRAPCDLAIVDINMPLMDGLTLVRQIRAETAMRELPIIIVTTEEDAGDQEKAFDAGANAYLVKPTDPADLVEQARLLLGAAGRL